MNTKSDCWLCGRGYGIDNGDMLPGTMHLDEEGDMICIFCEAKINFTARIIGHPELIRLVGEIKGLPKIEGIGVGLRIAEAE
jgi:hypothetical protein